MGTGTSSSAVQVNFDQTVCCASLFAEIVLLTQEFDQTYSKQTTLVRTLDLLHECTQLACTCVAITLAK